MDATYSTRLGRFVNDSIKPNCVMKAIHVAGQTRLCLFALTNICAGEEIRYNYGVPGLSWRKVTLFNSFLLFV